MITLYGFGTIFPDGIGETKDLRVQWALEETGLPYRVHAVDHTGGEHQGEAYGRISPFRQVPVIDDDGFVVSESAAIVLYLAEKAGKLIPAEVQGRTRVVQWCLAAVSTVHPTFQTLDLIGIFDPGNAHLTAEIRKVARSSGSGTWSAAWTVARGSRARTSRWPTSRWPACCATSARPTCWTRSRTPGPTTRAVWRGRRGSARWASTPSDSACLSTTSGEASATAAVLHATVRLKRSSCWTSEKPRGAPRRWRSCCSLGSA